MKNTHVVPFLLCALLASSLSIAQSGSQVHFDPKGKPPSEHTKRIITDARKSLPFSDRRDFAEQSRGFIAAPDSMQIVAEDGTVVWDLERFRFLLSADESESIHPSLLRQSQLNMNFGLYEVMEGVYQVRGFDLANITFVRSETGWIVLDALTARETAAAAYELLSKHVDQRPIVAVIYSHTHGDHWGGVRGIVDEQDVAAGRVQIIAPDEFMQHAISENIFAGTAMTRRMYYQYGLSLPASPYGHAGQGLAQTISRGTVGLIAPTKLVTQPEEEITVDGVRMVFQLTPDTEAPAEMNTYFPDMKLLWVAENVTGTFHNIYTLRGAAVRDALGWSKYINEVIYSYGQEAQTMMASHHWPRWGNARIQEVLRGQRDLYANINNQVLHHANQGVTINEIHNVYETPESIANQWYNRGYHGSPEHNSRAVINRYLGYWDDNPTTLIPLSPGESAPLYVEMMGGADNIIAKGRELHEAGQYKLATEILDKLVYAQPDNQDAKDLLADVFEQLGYQQENPGLRNSFLNGAYELRSGIHEGFAGDTSSPDVLRALDTGSFLDALAIQLDARKVEDLEFKMNIVTPDNHEEFILELSNSTLTNIKGFQAKDAKITVTANRSDLLPVLMGASSLRSQVEKGDIELQGNIELWERLVAAMTKFDPYFEILPGTKN